MSKTSIVIHESQMSEEMKNEFLQVAHQAVNKYTEDSDITRYIKMEFDGRHGGTWSCDVGFSGHRKPHDKNTYIHFSVGNTRITLYKEVHSF